MIYSVNAMFLIEIDMPTWRCGILNKEGNKAGTIVTSNIIKKAREVAHIHEFTAKQIGVRRYNSKVVPREMN